MNIIAEGAGLTPQEGENLLRGVLAGPYSAQSLELALAALPVGVCCARLADRSILVVNNKFQALFGYQAGELLSLEHWIEQACVEAGQRRQASEAWAPLPGGPGDQQAEFGPIELRILCKDGSEKTVLYSGVTLAQPGWALCTFVDISARKEYEERSQAAERQARENESIYRLLLDHSPGMIILAPFDKSKRYVSPAVEQLTGFTSQEYLSMRHPGMLHPDDHERAREVVREIRGGHLSQVFRYRTLQKRGGYKWVEAVITGYLHPETHQAAGYIATVRDISEQKIREENLAYENRQLSAVASIDELTGIANRRTFNQTLEVEGRRQARSGGSLSLLLLDVDYFKQYNDLYGHLPGDACLRRIATTLQQNLRRAGDLAARYGGEEFVALLPLTDNSGAAATARGIVQAISALKIPHAGSPHQVVTISIGIATWPPEKPLSHIELLEKADRALYEAKRGGRNRYHVLEQNEKPE